MFLHNNKCFYINTFGQILLLQNGKNKDKYIILNINTNKNQIPLPNFILDFMISYIDNLKKDDSNNINKSKIKNFIKIYKFDFVNNIAHMHSQNDFDLQKILDKSWILVKSESKKEMTSKQQTDNKLAKTDIEQQFQEHQYSPNNHNNLIDEIVYVIDIFTGNIK